MRRVVHSKFAGMHPGAGPSGNGGAVTSFFTGVRKDRLLHEQVHDPYRATSKPVEPCVCPICHAVFKGGRWQWLEFWPADSHPQTCQACQRIRDNYPAGFVTMSGDFIATHRLEVLHLARHHERVERAEHPLHRIMSIEDHPDTVVVATTDIHLPKRIGQALHRAYKGRLDLHYDKESCFVRVHWTAGADRSNKTNAKKRR